MNEKVSVIIPVFNTEEYIENCYRSIRDQTYQNFEIILVEDGSKDDSLRLCKEIAAKDERVKVIEHFRNQGQEATRNDGIINSNGDWILFVDSDDTIDSRTIESLVEKSREFDADIVLCDFCNIQDGKNRIESAFIDEGIYSHDEIVGCFLNEISWQMISCIGNKLYKTELIKENSILFDKNYKYNEDGAFALIAFDKADRIYYIKHVGYNYLIRSDHSVQSSYRENFYDTVKNVHALLDNILIKVEKSKIKRALIIQKISFIFVCLKNEVDYKGFSEYLLTCKKIHNDEKYVSACKAMRIRYSISKWFFAKTFLLKQYKLLYYLIGRS